VRELQNLMQRLSILKRVGQIELEDLPAQFHGDNPPPPQLGLYVPSEGMDMADTLERLETSLVKQALQKADGNKAAAARLLGLNRTTLVEKVKRLRIQQD
jgi:DNA-binding NtrC family response regulator